MYVQAISLAQHLRTPAWRWWAPAGAFLGWWASSLLTWLSTLPASAGRLCLCLNLTQHVQVRLAEVLTAVIAFMFGVCDGLTHASRLRLSSMPGLHTSRRMKQKASWCHAWSWP